MSGYLMPVPDELQADGVPERLELMVTLPAEWPLTYKDLRNKANYWPIQMLKKIHHPNFTLGWLYTSFIMHYRK